MSVKLFLFPLMKQLLSCFVFSMALESSYYVLRTDSRLSSVRNTIVERTTSVLSFPLPSSSSRSTAFTDY